jgi:hypothetical protein
MSLTKLWVPALAQYCSDTHHRHGLVSLVERSTPMPNAEAAHLAPDAAWVEASATADAAASSDLVKHRFAPGSESLRGELPQLAAFFA